jgi:hypothetical protein
MTKVVCDKIDCKYHPAHKKDTIFAEEGICDASEIYIEDQGNCFSCNSYEESQ